jgi:hypothetical protein
MSLGLNKILISGTASNTPGAYWQLSTLTATTTGNAIPAGTYLVFPNANCTINAVSAYNTSTNVATYSILLAANTGGVIISDGLNVTANATTNTTITLATVNGGQAVSSTFTS